MTCLDGVLTDPVFLGVLAISALAAVVMVWMLKAQAFHGKPHYALTFVGMIWTLLAVGSEAASSDIACQLQWATWAWIGNALVPIAWCFFVFAYVEHAAWLNRQRAVATLVIVPGLIFAVVATNPWHHLVYAETSFIPPGKERIEYIHGPAFYAIIAVLYAFVLATLVCLGKAFVRSKRVAWPLLGMLVVITITPLTANAAYVVLGFTIFGLDPTAFMFTLGVLAFTWLLLTNKTMDMASVGQSILFNTMSEPVILIDRQHKIVLMNTAAKRSGLRQCTDRLVSDALANVERWSTSEEIPQLSIGQRVYEPRVQEIESPLNPSNAALGWSVTFVDITDRIAIHSALETALRSADNAMRAKDEFISVISHELRTPLTSLKGGLALALSGRLGDLSDPVRSSLEIAHRNGVRLSRLVDNILLGQKLDLEALTLEREPVALDRLLRESVDENRMFAVERGVQLTMAECDETACVMGDAFAIRQIIDNLISNAIKFSNQHGIVECTLKTSDERVRLSIKDTGRGIPEGMETRVFGRFEQIRGDGQYSIQGSGLGLHISKQLAKQMSGDLFYESEVGVGTTFHIEFRAVNCEQLARLELAG